MNTRDGVGDTILMTAAFIWRWDIIHELIDKGADISLGNRKGPTALSLALRDCNLHYLQTSIFGSITGPVQPSALQVLRIPEYAQAYDTRITST